MNALALEFGFGQHGQKNAGQNCDDRNDDQQFNQRKGGKTSRSVEPLSMVKGTGSAGREGALAYSVRCLHKDSKVFPVLCRDSSHSARTQEADSFGTGMVHNVGAKRAARQQTYSGNGVWRRICGRSSAQSGHQ
jgi:hypothetical protein